jgi:hypothetical protein
MHDIKLQVESNHNQNHDWKPLGNRRFVEGTVSLFLFLFFLFLSIKMISWLHFI